MRAGMDPAVAEELLQGHAGDLAADAVEAGQDHGVRGVVDDEVDAGEVLERADVAALAADDAALHVVGGELDDGDRRLGGVAGGEPLHDDGEDVADAAVGVALGLLLDLAHEPRRVVADLVLELLEQELLGLRGGQPGDALELARVAVAGGGGLLDALVQELLAGVEFGGARVQGLLARDQPLLQAPDLLAARVGVIRLCLAGHLAGCGDAAARGRRRQRAGGREPGGSLHQQ